MSERNKPPDGDRTDNGLLEGKDFYIEDGLMVLTASYLRSRGYCCGNLCRNCPYTIEEQSEALKKKLL